MTTKGFLMSLTVSLFRFGSCSFSVIVLVLFYFGATACDAQVLLVAQGSFLAELGGGGLMGPRIKPW